MISYWPKSCKSWKHGDYFPDPQKTGLYDTLMIRARYYRNVINPSTGYAQGRYADGSFLTDAGNVFSFTRFITEGLPAIILGMPHDIYGLMECMGGKEKYIAKLDSMFSEHRYWHGNEPCHQIAYLFNYAGQPWKTQREDVVIYGNRISECSRWCVR